jgi:hypothetical protein
MPPLLAARIFGFRIAQHAESAAHADCIIPLRVDKMDADKSTCEDVDKSTFEDGKVVMWGCPNSHYVNQEHFVTLNCCRRCPLPCLLWWRQCVTSAAVSLAHVSSIWMEGSDINIMTCMSCWRSDRRWSSVITFPLVGLLELVLLSWTVLWRDCLTKFRLTAISINRQSLIRRCTS